MRKFVIPVDDQIEFTLRVAKLTNPPRRLSSSAAVTVVLAAMFGEGCIEGKVRARIQAELEASHDTVSQSDSSQIQRPQQST